MDFEIRLLRYALALAEHRNFARAARSLKITQPGLSRSIQSLERLAGVQIFDRGSRTVEVTDAGAVFLEYAHEVMSHSSDLSREMDLLKGLDKGELQIGVGTYMSMMFVDRAIARIVREHPEVRLRIANDTWISLLPLLRRRELDLAVIDVRTLVDDQEYHITPLTRRQGYLAVRPSHPLLQHKGGLTMRDVLGYPFISTSRFPPGLLRQFVSESASGENSLRPGPKSFPSIACESLGMMKNIVQESDAVAILPLNFILADLESRTIAVLPVELPMLKGELGIVRLARRSLSPLGELFVRRVLEVDTEVAATEEKAAKRLFAAQQRSTRSAHPSIPHR
jgi:DNA-binding transcriptional LysR family regulator